MLSSVIDDCCWLAWSATVLPQLRFIFFFFLHTFADNNLISSRSCLPLLSLTVYLAHSFSQPQSYTTSVGSHQQRWQWQQQQQQQLALDRAVTSRLLYVSQSAGTAALFLCTVSLHVCCAVLCLSNTSNTSPGDRLPPVSAKDNNNSNDNTAAAATAASAGKKKQSLK